MNLRAPKSGEVKESADGRPDEGALRLTQFTVDRAADCILWVSASGRIVYANETACRRYGHSKQKVTGLGIGDIAPGLSGDSWGKRWQEIKAKGASAIETTHRAKDGELFPVEVRANYVAHNGAEYVIAFVRDISERRRSEEMLRLTELSVERAADLIHWIGPDGRILFANEASCRRDGYSREELLAMTIFDLDPKLSPESWPEAWRTLKEAGSRTIESLHRTKAGEIYPVEVSANYVEHGGQEYDFVFARDITERKRAEEALTEGEVRYRVLVDTTSDLIYSYDTALKLTGINRAAAQTLGLEPHEATGKSMDELGLAEQTLSLWKRMTQEVLDSKAPVREVVEVVMPDGETHAYESVLEPVFTGTGEIGGLRGAGRDITERRRLEQSLKLTQFSVDHAADMISWMTPEGRFVYANDTICRRLGYEREELVGLTIYDVDPQAPRPWDDHWQELKRRGSLTFETVHRAKTGEILPVEVTANYVEYEGQEYNLSLARDIIDRMRVEAQLRESEERFRGIFEQGSVGIALIDPDQRFVRANSTFCEMLGYKEDELVGMSIRAVTAKEDVEHSLTDTGALYSGARAVLSMDKRYLRKDGELVWGHVSAALVRDKDGAPIGTVAMVQDITERKRAEEALRESEAKTRSILNNIGSGVALISPQMEILEVNHQMREWYPHLNPGQHPVCYRAFNNPPRAAVCDYCPTQKTLQDGLVHEATTQTPQGDTVRNFRVVSSPILSATGEVTAAIEMVEDITDRLSLEFQLRQSQKMEAVGQLAGGIAHDFNNLLTAIIGNSSLALATLAPEDPNRELIGDIKETGERAAGLTRQILAFSRRQILKPQILQLNDVLLSIGPLLRRTLGEDVDLHFSLAPDLKETEVDPHQMEQVLMNLALNARDAMPEGGSLTIETANVRLERTYARAHPEVEPGHYVMLAVSDTGCGMEEETKSHIFEPFFTTKEVGKGTGLGLSTVFGIVKQSGGFISVYSEPGKGSTFKVYLPISHTAIAAEADSLEEAEAKSGSETILVVEDEAPVREVVTRILSRSGYTVLEAGSAREVDAVLKGDGPVPDLLLTDVVLPGGRSGQEVAEVILARYPGLPVVFMSGYTRDSVVHNGRLDEGIEFLEKPFTPKKLLQKVRFVLDAMPATRDVTKSLLVT